MEKNALLLVHPAKFEYAYLGIKHLGLYNPWLLYAFVVNVDNFWWAIPLIVALLDFCFFLSFWQQDGSGHPDLHYRSD